VKPFTDRYKDQSFVSGAGLPALARRLALTRGFPLHGVSPTLLALLARDGKAVPEGLEQGVLRIRALPTQFSDQPEARMRIEGMIERPGLPQVFTGMMLRSRAEEELNKPRFTVEMTP